MRNLPLRRSGALAMALLLMGAGLAFADGVPADGDSVATGNQGLIDLGERSPGQAVVVNVNFTLTCSGVSHAIAGSTFSVQPSSYGFPLDGTLDATSTTITVPSPWPPSGGCPSGLAVPANGPSTVTMTMPTTPGTDYMFSVMYARVPSTGVTGTTAMTFQVDVVGNTPPSLSTPASFSVEATSAAGATVSYTVATGDAEDVPAPAAVCTPTSGSIFPLGTTTVACTVTDSGGLSAPGSFDVTVVDTTPPALAGLPADMSVTTADSSGTTLAYAPPTATDAVDASPAVACAPAPGSAAPVGVATVTCTATDDAGNSSSASFHVTVTYVAPTTWSVVWGEPVGGTPPSLVANRGRTIPVKVEIFSDGIEHQDGRAAIRVDACGGGTALRLPLAWGSGRWSVNFDTTPLAPGCYRVTARHEGHDAGSFALDLRGSEAAKASKARSAGLARLTAPVKHRSR